MAQLNTPAVWALKKGADRRIRSGHPWVFSNELQVSPKGLKPGSSVLLYDSQNQFVAAGYGNPNSLISFRALSFDKVKENFFSDEFLVEKLLAAWQRRFNLGLKYSYRLCFSEADSLPGMIVDWYVCEVGKKRSQVFAVQILTAGMQELAQNLESVLKELVEKSLHISKISWDDTSVVLRNDVNIRKLEGLNYEDSKIIKGEAESLKNIPVLLQQSAGDEFIILNADLVEGQKTGLFLDQSFNIDLVNQILQKRFAAQKPTEMIRILDLCCYMGQWSAKIARELIRLGCQVEATAVDVSDHALSFAKQNIARTRAQVITKKLDVAQNLSQLPEKFYDIVIADPPAFIKAKKDVPIGTHAYLKLNTNSFKLVKENGLLVSCSCSGLFTKEDMIETLAKSIKRAQVKAFCLAQGGPSLDHPTMLQFPEGNYLKMFVHQVI